jgi:two-component system, NtrC family, response regulator
MGSLEGALPVHAADHDLIILDVNLSEDAHQAVFHRIIELPNRPQVIVVTESADPGLAESAIIKGAWEYFQKPPPLSRLKMAVQRAVEFSRKTRAKDPIVLKRCGIVGSSSMIRSCLEAVAGCADSASNVLIVGETGTGKELFARAIHYNSSRKDFPFVIVDCAALPDTLVESILFGHEKGAFTTAEKKHAGLIRHAHGGTLFLDEIGELPLGIQKSFLRVLQERTFRPVGGIQEVYSDFRLIAATNKDLQEMAARGAFRQDLLYRVQTIPIKLPPLRGREMDIKELMHHFLDRICKKHGYPSKGFSPAVIEAFTEYHWPGNVRELINALEHAVVSARGDPIVYPEHLPVTIRVHATQQLLSLQDGPAGIESPAKGPACLPKLKTYRAQALAEIERTYLLELLDRTRGNIIRACELSGMSRPRLYAMIKKHGVR